jgi:hypothetical protein
VKLAKKKKENKRIIQSSITDEHEKKTERKKTQRTANVLVGNME